MAKWLAISVILNLWLVLLTYLYSRAIGALEEENEKLRLSPLQLLSPKAQKVRPGFHRNNGDGAA